jgi:hypothetical protein
MRDANYSAVYAAALYAGLAEISRKHEYALAVRGSLTRDKVFKRKKQCYYSILFFTKTSE